ncbi:MAG: LexA family transcriptional regulator [Prosthecobacter sp.]|uniref:helix-turn-helix domain-containing protein n=1 Tax=Prosthecobacter sp. TaxID=1965333 RepID=UPI0025E5CB70|nr:LexA family transcriptional regulator [Prosthecobacter sp.]MCF7785581.1 LexA family transcriptional regulator [Prosthecobacter sp.]
MENISTRLKNLRQRLQLNQEEMGKLLGVTGKYVSMLERGYKEADDDSTLSKLLSFHEQKETMVREDASGYVTGARAKLKTAREAKGVTQAQLAKAIGYSDLGTYQNIEDGHSQMGEKMAIKAAKILGIDVSELMDGSDHLVDRSPSGGTFGAVPDIRLPPGMTAKFVPLLSLAECGPAMTWTDEAYAGEGALVFDCKDPKAFAVKLSGDSMQPKYDAGETAIIYPSFQPRNGDVVLARLNDDLGGDVMVKLYQKSGDTITLSSYNHVYQPMTYPRASFALIYPVAQITKNLR